MIGIDSSRLVEEIKARVTLSDVVSRHVKLKRAGRHRMSGLCPFHHEKTPSFFVDDDKGLYHCFGCGKGGDVISFLMEIEGLSFKEAVEDLAKMCGLEIPDGWLGASKRESSLSERLMAINKAAGGFYFNLLQNDPAASYARSYLIERNVETDMIKRFGLGFAPDSWDVLLLHLKSSGFSQSEIERAGLAIQGSKGFYDRFRNRIMFPILMREKQLLGFSGRTLSSDEKAKYINTPETPIYSKSKVLFGFNLARDSISKQGIAIVVEGNFDVLRMHQFGFHNVVAPCGTALTTDQVRLIKRLGADVLLLFDGDVAGLNAAFRTLSIVIPLMVKTKVVFLPQGEDPDSLLLAKGKNYMDSLLDSAQDLFSAYIEYQRKMFGDSPESLAKLIQDVASLLISVSSPAVKEAYINHASYLLGVSEKSLRASMYQISKRNHPNFNRFASVESANVEELDPDEIGLILSVIQNRHLVYEDWFWDRLSNIKLSSAVEEIFNRIKQDPEYANSILNFNGRIGVVLRRKLMELDDSDDDSVNVYLLKLEEKQVRDDIDRLGMEISRAERESDNDRLRELIIRRRDLYRRRDEILESVKSIKNSLTRSSADGG